MMSTMTVTAISGDLIVAARLFHGLSDPTRLSILLALRDGERRVTDLVAAVGSSQSNVSNHLACLRECGLVVDRPAERRQVFYSIARPELFEVLAAFVDHGIALRTDDPDELRQIADVFGATSDTVHDHTGATTDVGHTDQTYLVDANGDIIVTWTADMTTDDLEHDLRIVLDDLHQGTSP